MRNLFENIAIVLVLILSALIIYLIVRYNDVDDEIVYTIPIEKTVTKKEKSKAYLDNLEGYTDVDVKIDPTTDDSTNRVIVNSQDDEDHIEKAIKDDYAENLESYAEESKNIKENTEELPAKKEVPISTSALQEEVSDEIGMAIEDVLN